MRLTTAPLPLKGQISRAGDTLLARIKLRLGQRRMIALPAQAWISPAAERSTSQNDRNKNKPRLRQRQKCRLDEHICIPAPSLRGLEYMCRGSKCRRKKALSAELAYLPAPSGGSKAWATFASVGLSSSTTCTSCRRNGTKTTVVMGNVQCTVH